MTVIGILAILGIGGGFAILAYYHRLQLRAERRIRWMRTHGLHSMADGLIDIYCGCYCGACRRDRLRRDVEEYNKELAERTKRLREQLNELRALVCTFGLTVEQAEANVRDFAAHTVPASVAGSQDAGKLEPHDADNE